MRRKRSRASSSLSVARSSMPGTMRVGARAAMLNRVEELRQMAIAKVRESEGAVSEDAFAFFDEALALTTDDETRELITINKADAMITMQRGGPEVAELPRILMRRRNPR